MKTEAQKRAVKKYNAKRVRVPLDFYPSEGEMIAHIKAQPSPVVYIKSLIQADMEEKKNV